MRSYFRIFFQSICQPVTWFISDIVLEDILQGRENEFLKSLQMLERETKFSMPRLELEVDRIKSCVAEVRTKNFFPFYSFINNFIIYFKLLSYANLSVLRHGSLLQILMQIITLVLKIETNRFLHLQITPRMPCLLIVDSC